MSKVIIIAPIWLDSVSNVIERIKLLGYEYLIITQEKSANIPNASLSKCYQLNKNSLMYFHNLSQVTLAFRPTIIHLIVPEAKHANSFFLKAYLYTFRMISNLAFVISLDSAEVLNAKIISCFDGAEVRFKRDIPKLRRLVPVIQVQIPLPIARDSSGGDFYSNQIEELLNNFSVTNLTVLDSKLEVKTHKGQKFLFDRGNPADLDRLIRVSQSIDFASVTELNSDLLYWVKVAQDMGKLVTLSLQQKQIWDYIDAPGIDWNQIRDYAVNNLERIYISSQVNASQRRV